MKNISNLKVKIFADGANKEGMLEMYNKDFIMGLTTNPTLMKKAGIKDYEFLLNLSYPRLRTSQYLLKFSQMKLKKWRYRLIKLQNGVIMFMLKFL
jgi:hypothetical protein